MFLSLSNLVRAFAISIFVSTPMIVGASGQNVPNHVDPSAYDDTLDLSEVPSIRFLTSPDFPPFNFKDVSGEISGFNIELAEALCAELVIECTMQSWPWGQLAKALEDGHGDAIIAGLGIDAASGRMFDFSNSYLQLPGRFVRLNRAGNSSGFDPFELTTTVGVRQGSSHHDFVEQHFPNLVVLTFDRELDVLSAVAAGSVGIGFVDGMRTSFWLNQNDCCSFAGGAYFSEEHFGAGLAVAVSRDKGNTLRAINMGLRRLGENRKLDELYLKWFPVGFY